MDGDGKDILKSRNDFVSRAVKLGSNLAELVEDAFLEGLRLGRRANDPVIWETKCGCSVRILCTDKPGRYPIVGYFIDATDKIILHWTATGRLMGGDAIMMSDLVIPEGFNVGEPDKTETGRS